MKGISILGLVILASSSLVQAMTVKEGDITGKTNLIGISQASVNGTLESVLTDSSGLSIYTFELDSANVSKCSGSCVSVWPPLHVPAGSAILAPFGKIKGNDGQDQLTLDGFPLYHYSADKKPGDAFGQYPKWNVVIVN